MKKGNGKEPLCPFCGKELEWADFRDRAGGIYFCSNCEEAFEPQEVEGGG